MDAKPRTRFLRLIEVLVRHEVEFLIVGGVAALLEGAPILTLDLDILARQTPANIDRLVIALTEVSARYRDPAGRVVLQTPPASLQTVSTFSSRISATSMCS